MSVNVRNDARLNVRLPSELKQTVEEAAAALGQSVSEFTVACTVREARAILDAARSTALSDRDRDLFLAALDDTSLKPNEALKRAARHYKKQLRTDG